MSRSQLKQLDLGKRNSLPSQINQNDKFVRKQGMNRARPANQAYSPQINRALKQSTVLEQGCLSTDQTI